MKEQHYLDLATAAERLGVSAAYIRKLIVDGRLAYRKMLRRDLYPGKETRGRAVLVVPAAEIDHFATTRRPRGRPKGSTKRRRRGRAA